MILLVLYHTHLTYLLTFSYFILLLQFSGKHLTLCEVLNLVNLVVKCDGLAFGAFPGCVTISAAQARESDDLHHAMSPFSLFLSYFSGTQRILGYVRPRRIVAAHPPKTWRRRSIWRRRQTGTASARRCAPLTDASTASLTHNTTRCSLKVSLREETLAFGLTSLLSAAITTSFIYNYYNWKEHLLEVL